MADDFSLNAVLTANAKGFTAGVESATQSLSGLGDKLENITNKINDGTSAWGLDLKQFYSKGSDIFKSFGVDLDKFASHFGVNGIVLSAIVGATAALVKFGEEMNVARANIVKGTGAIGKDLRELEDDFHSVLVGGIGRSVDEVSNMMADINTRFGSTGEELKALTIDFDKFGTVTDTDVRQSIKGVADIMGKWNLSMKDSKGLMDQLTKTAQMSGASVTDLMNAVKNGQQTFTQFGMSVTDSLSFLGTLAQKGVDSATAMQGLKTALVKFTAEGKNAKQGLSEITKKIENAKSDTEALKLAVETFGGKAGPEMVEVLKSGALSADEFAEALRNAGGTVETTETLSRTMKDALDELKNVFVGVGAGLGSGFSDLFRDIIDSVQVFVKPIAEALQPLFDIFGEVFSFIGSLIKEFASAIERARERFGNSVDNITVIITLLRDNIRKIFGNVLDIVKSIFNMIFAILDGKWGLAWENAKMIMLKVLDSILSALSTFLNIFVSQINKIIEIVNKLIATWNKVSGENVKPVELISNIDLSKSTGLMTLISDTKKKIKSLSGETAKDVIGDIKSVKDVIGATVNDTIKADSVLKEWDDKILQQKIDTLKKEANYEVEMAKKQGATAEEIYNIKKNYTDKENELITQQLEHQRAAEVEKLKNVKTSAEQRARAIDKVNEYYDKEIENLKKYSSETSDFSKSFSLYFKGISKDLKERAKDWSKFYETVTNSVKNFIKNGLEKIGENLVQGKASWKDYASMAVEMIAQILEGLAAQLTALAAVNFATHQYGKAAAALAGAGAAMVAAGALKAIANGMKAVSEQASNAVNNTKKFNELIKGIRESSTDVASTLTGYKQMFAVISEAENNLLTIEKELGERMGFVIHYTEYGAYSNLTRDYSKTGVWTKMFKSVNDAIDNYTAAVQASRNFIKNVTNDVMQQIDSLIQLENMYKRLYSARMSEADMDYIRVMQWKKLKDESIKIWESLIDVGSTIGEKLIDAVVNGASRRDFKAQMGAYLKEQMIKLTIYTDTFTRQMSNIGAKLTKALALGIEESEDIFASVSKELDDLYKDVEVKTKGIDTVIEKFFGKVDEEAESFESSFKNLGADIGSNFTSALQEGMGLEDFLDSMKKWLKNMIVQMVVYTDTMKNKIETIGSKIAEFVQGGATDKDFLKGIKQELALTFDVAYLQTDIINDILDDVFKGAWATGVNNAPSGLSLVGEQGPELIDFKGGERVYNANNTKNLLSGAGTSNNFNVTFNNLQDTSAFAMMNQLKRYNREMAINGIF